jgi:hypothetical protein
MIWEEGPIPDHRHHPRGARNLVLQPVSLDQLLEAGAGETEDIGGVGAVAVMLG